MQACKNTDENAKNSDSSRKVNRGVSKTDTTPIVFVTGASRSGTTMLARLLGAHSAIHTFRELHYFGDLVEVKNLKRSLSEEQAVILASSLVARSLRGIYCYQPNEDERRVGKKIANRLKISERTPTAIFSEVLRHITEANYKRIPCEQTGRNIFYSETLLAIYPRAKIINIIRDPRAVLASQKNRWKMRKLGAAHIHTREMIRNWVNYHPLTMSRLWIKSIGQGIQLNNHNRFMTIRYEDLTAESESQTRKLCKFLSLTYEPAMIEIPMWGSSNLFYNEKQKGLSKLPTEKWRETLTVSEIIISETMTQNLMQHFNYRPEYLNRRGFFNIIPLLITFLFHALAVMVVNPRRAWIQLKALVKVPFDKIR